MYFNIFIFLLEFLQIEALKLQNPVVSPSEPQTIYSVLQPLGVSHITYQGEDRTQTPFIVIVILL